MTQNAIASFDLLGMFDLPDGWRLYSRRPVSCDLALCLPAPLILPGQRFSYLLNRQRSLAVTVRAIVSLIQELSLHPIQANDRVPILCSSSRLYSVSELPSLLERRRTNARGTLWYVAFLRKIACIPPITGTHRREPKPPGKCSKVNKQKHRMREQG